MDAGAPCGLRAPAPFRLTGRPVDRAPLAPVRGRLEEGPQCGPTPNRLDRGSPRARQCRRLSRDRGTFHRARPPRACEGPSRRAGPAGRPAQLPCVFTDVRRHRLDPSSRRFRGAHRGHARSHDFCRWRSPRARPRTTRTSSLRGDRGRDDCRASIGSCLPTPAVTGGARGQGPSKPLLGARGRDCSRARLCPDPDRSGHLVSRGAISHRSGATG